MKSRKKSTKARRRKDIRKAKIKNNDYDSRHYGGGRIEVTNTNPNLIIEPTIMADSLTAVATFFVNLFISRGGQEVSPSEAYPKHGRIYIAEALRQVALGGTIEMVTAPRVFGIIADFLPKRQARNYNANVSFNFDIVGDVSLAGLIPSGPSNNSMINHQKKSATAVVNGVIPVTEAVAAYTEAGGLLAVQFIWDYLSANVDHDLFKMERFPLKDAKWTVDASAFGFAIDALGSGQGGIGGQAKVVALELNIRTPNAVNFVATKTGGSPYLGRAPCHSISSVGDGTYMAGLFSLWLEEKQFSSKRKNVIKYYDFNEVLDILSQAICQAQQLAVLDPDTIESLFNDPNFYVTNIQFSVTQQMLALALRNLCLMVAARGQLTTSTVYPTQEIGNINVFRPFVCGVGQGPYSGGTPLELPIQFMEMLACTAGKRIEPSNWSTSPLIATPCWGVYEQDVLSPDAYYTEYVFNEDTVKGACFPTDVTEAKIDLVDGAVGSEYAMMNDSFYLNAITVQINDWFKRNGDYFNTLAPLSADGGINVLSTIMMTSHTIDNIDRSQPEVVDYIPGEDQMKTSEVKAIKQILAMKRQKVLREGPQTYYQNRAVLSVTNYDDFQDSVVTGLGQFTLTPVNNLTSIVSTGDNNSIQSMQAWNKELFSQVSGQGVNKFTTQAEKHTEIALQMVKTKYAPANASATVYDQAMKDGEGGLIGALIKASGTVATEVGKAVIKAGVDVLADNVTGMIDGVAGALPI